VSLVDINRQWFKSNVGLDTNETHRDLAFCSYTVLSTSPEVFVVPDASKDPRFKNNALVTGAPFIRFYAGAALVIAGTRVGSLCVIDRVPHENFSFTDRMNLLDLGEAVSTIIKERRESALSIGRERTKILYDTMHNIRTPLMSINMASSMIERKKETIITLLNEEKEDSGESGLGEKI